MENLKSVTVKCLALGAEKWATLPETRALLGYNMVMTTRELFPFVWPRLDPDQPWPEWKWLKVRRAAEKFAFRLGPRARPLKWKLKVCEMCEVQEIRYVQLCGARKE